MEVDVQPDPQSNSQFGLVKAGGFIKLECQKLQIAMETKPRKTAFGVEDDVYTWTLVEGDQDAKMHPNVYLDSPEDDFEDISGRHSLMWLVPAYTNSSGDLIGLLLQQRKASDHFSRVGLSAIPRYVSAEKAFLDRASVDENGKFKMVPREVIQIV